MKKPVIINLHAVPDSSYEKTNIRIEWDDGVEFRYHFWLHDYDRAPRDGKPWECTVYRNRVDSNGVLLDHNFRTQHLSATKGYGKAALAVIIPLLPELREQAERWRLRKHSEEQAQREKAIRADAIAAAAPRMFAILERLQYRSPGELFADELEEIKLVLKDISRQSEV